MSEDLLRTAEKYLYPSRLSPADIEDAPRVIRALAGALSSYRIFGTDVVTKTALVKCMSDAGDVGGLDEMADAIMDKFKVVKK